MTRSHTPFRRPLALLLAGLLALAALVGLDRASTSTADAATVGAGYHGITPYGGYLGNYIAPDGACVAIAYMAAEAHCRASELSSPTWFDL